MFGVDDILSIAGPVLSGIMGSAGAEEAAGIQSDAAREAAQLTYKAQQEALAEQRRQYDTNRGDMLQAIQRTSPYQIAGTGAAMRLADLVGVGGGSRYRNAANANWYGTGTGTSGTFGTGGARSLEEIVAGLRSSGRYGSSGGGLEKAINFEETGNGGQYVFADGTRSDNQYRMKGGTVDESALMAEANRIYGSQGGASGGASGGGDPRMDAAIQLANRDAMAGRGYALTAAELADPAKQAELRSIISSFDTNADNRKFYEGLYPGEATAPDAGALMKNFTLADFEEDPGYQFRKGEGEKAIERAARARGTYMSPMTVKELLRYNSGIASDEFGNAYNRDSSNKTRAYNFLAGLSGTGQTANNTVGSLVSSNASMGAANASNIGNILMGGASSIGNALTGGANARGAAAIAGGNAFGSGIASGLSNYNQSQLLKKLLAGGTTGPSYPAIDT